MAELPMPEEKAGKSPLTAEERRANVRRVEHVEKELERLTYVTLNAALSAAGAYRALHALRADLRTVLDLPALDPPPPLIAQLRGAEAAERSNDE